MFASETLNVFLSPPSSKSAKNDSNSSTISPQKPEIDPEFDFERKFHVPLAENFKKRQWKHNFRGIPWIFEIFERENHYFLRIFCNKLNKSRLWGCSAHISVISCDSRLICTEKDVEFDSETHFETDLPLFVEKIEIFVQISIKTVIGMNLKPFFDFSQPKTDIFDAILLWRGGKCMWGNSEKLRKLTYWVLKSKKLSKSIFSAKIFSNLFSKTIFQYLATYSPFLNDLLEVIPEFEIPDVKFDDFIEFLHFLYPTDAEMTSSNVERLLNLAHRFEVEILKSKCEKFLISLDSMDAAWKLILAETFSLSRLQNHVLQNLTTEKDVQKVSKSAHYRQMTDTTKTSLLNRVLEIMEKKEDSDEDDDDEEEVSMPDESDDVIYVE
ncbi:hypothetical protein CRE_01251 [Caenorhabditis remanei]|uniref:BTB domain-containing protein n=1 Tax=Caenorhabditis remanei TaxID=31234 RepID=E3N9S3_CAERE|nr:hypothetical protein CRE_01251 [Caenorhabditis remanei]